MEPAAPEGVVIRTIDDRRRPARGWSRILVVVLAVLGLVILGPAVVTLIRDPGDVPVDQVLHFAKISDLLWLRLHLSYID